MKSQPRFAGLLATLLAVQVGCGTPATSSPTPQASLEDLPSLDLPLSVAEAYEAIPHRQTVFDFSTSPIGPVEASYLEASFFLIDQGTRARVTAYRDFYYQGSSSSRPVEQLEVVVGALRELEPPRNLEDYHEVLLKALVLHLEVLTEWSELGLEFPHRERIGDHAKVRQGSSALRRAYSLLMSRYGDQETQANREAFFDYHCALDFI